MKIDERICFEEKYLCQETEMITLYFTADKSLLKELTGDKYPEADGMTISIEYPAEEPEAFNAGVDISPYKIEQDGDDIIICDYDWRELDISYEEIEELMRIAEEKGKDRWKREEENV